jgi:broad specificity phosphatase PhoE
MEQRIWIVRHGNREDFLNLNWSKTAERPYDPGLSPDGEVQAREVGMGLRGEDVHAIYASPYLRTIQTACHIADVLDLPVRLEPGIGEILPNVAQLPVILSAEERLRRFGRLDASHAPIYQPVFPEAEDLAHRRAGETVDQIAARHPGENLVFVTHAAPVVGIVRHLTGTQEKIRVPLCAIFTLARNHNGWNLIQSADISHLSNQEASQRYVHVG